MSILGSGDIARVLPNDEKLYFASGVSDSAEVRRNQFSREEDLLLAQDLGRHVVYFSSLSVFYKDSPYTQHKLLMERLIKENFPVYTIMRLGNIAWGGNPHTIINYFKSQLAAGQTPDIQAAHRYVIDKDDFLHWVSLIPSWSCEMNTPGQRLSVAEIWQAVQDGKL